MNARGPKGQKRPADVIGNAVHVMKIATGQIEEDEPTAKKVRAQKAGTKGGPARVQIAYTCPALGDCAGGRSGTVEKVALSCFV